VYWPLVAIIRRREVRRHFGPLSFLLIAIRAGHSRSTATASVWMRTAPWSVWMILADPTCALASSADHLEPQRDETAFDPTAYAYSYASLCPIWLLVALWVTVICDSCQTVLRSHTIGTCAPPATPSPPLAVALGAEWVHPKVRSALSSFRLALTARPTPLIQSAAMSKSRRRRKAQSACRQ
jgi:hypothetical protein